MGQQVDQLSKVLLKPWEIFLI